MKRVFKTILAVICTISIITIVAIPSYATQEYEEPYYEETVNDSYFYFIYDSDPGSDWVREYIGKNDCVEGYFYRCSNSSRITELLLPIVMREFVETENEFYGITQDNKLIKFSVDGSHSIDSVQQVYEGEGELLSLDYSIDKICFLDDGNIIVLRASDGIRIAEKTCESIYKVFFGNTNTIACLTTNKAYAYDFEQDSIVLISDDHHSLNQDVWCYFNDEIYKEEGGKAFVPFTYPLSNYPVGSYYTYNGTACSSHANCTPSVSCNCKKYGGGIQCAGFARYASDQYAHLSSWVNTNADYNNSTRTISSASGAQTLFSSFGVGSYIRCANSGGGAHSFVIKTKTSTGIEVYECNITGLCKVGVRTLTWSNINSYYSSIIESKKHTFDGLISKYNADQHKVKCSTTGCLGYIFQHHYTNTPGNNATCAGCGYVGYIPYGGI